MQQLTNVDITLPDAEAADAADAKGLCGRADREGAEGLFEEYVTSGALLQLEIPGWRSLSDISDPSLPSCTDRHKDSGPCITGRHWRSVYSTMLTPKHQKG